MFTKLGLYGIFMVCLEWAAFEVTILLAGILGTTQLAAQGVVFNIDAFFFSVHFLAFSAQFPDLIYQEFDPFSLVLECRMPQLFE